MIWATVSFRSCFCWLYRASPSLAAKNIINLILILTIWWFPCVESSLVLLEEGVGCDQMQWGVVFALAPSLHSFWSYSPLISSSILGTYWPMEFIFQCPIFLPFHTVCGVLKARILKWFAIPFSSGPRFVMDKLSTLTCPSWVALHRLAHSFFELDKAVEDSHLQTRKRALLKHQIHWHPQLGLSLQDSEE